MKKTVLIAASFFALPLVAFAAPLQNIADIIGSVGGIVKMLIPLMVGVAIVYFFYGLVKYIQNPELKEGRKTMLAGILAIFIMVSLWGIVIFAQQSLNIGTGGGQPIPSPTFQ